MTRHLPILESWHVHANPSRFRLCWCDGVMMHADWRNKTEVSGWVLESCCMCDPDVRLLLDFDVSCPDCLKQGIWVQDFPYFAEGAPEVECSFGKDLIDYVRKLSTSASVHYLRKQMICVGVLSVLFHKHSQRMDGDDCSTGFCGRLSGSGIRRAAYLS
jgi:hypothetical protein